MTVKKNHESGMGLITLLIMSAVLAIGAGVLIGSYKNSTDLAQKIKNKSILMNNQNSLENFIRYSRSCSENISLLINSDIIRDFKERDISLVPSINQLLNNSGYSFVSINRESMVNNELKVNVILQKNQSHNLLIPMIFTLNSDGISVACGVSTQNTPQANQSLSDFCQTTGMHTAACQISPNAVAFSCSANEAVVGFQKVNNQVQAICRSIVYAYDQTPAPYCPGGQYKIITNRAKQYQLRLIRGCSSVFNPSDDETIVTTPTNQCTFSNLCRHSSHLAIRGPFTQTQCDQQKISFINQSGNNLIHTQCIFCDQNYYLCTSDS